jgi:hypothetical protein
MPSPGEAQRRAAELVEVDLQPGQEEEEGEAQRGEHLDRQVDVDPVKDGPEQDAGHDLQHDGRNANTRRQSQKERREEGHCGHGKQLGEGDHRGRAERAFRTFGLTAVHQFVRPALLVL